MIRDISEFDVVTYIKLIFLCSLSAPKCQSKVDLCFVIDSSGSIRDTNVGTADNWQQQLEFIAALSSAFIVGPDDSRVGVVVFGSDANLEFNLNAYDNNADLAQAIRRIPFIGGVTNTRDALIATRTQCFNPSNGDRNDVSNLAIVITDGTPFPESNRQPAINEARALRNAGAVMISVGITNSVDEAFLKEISSSPQILNQNYFSVPNFNALNQIQKTVVEGTCESIEGKNVFSFIFTFQVK